MCSLDLDKPHDNVVLVENSDLVTQIKKQQDELDKQRERQSNMEATIVSLKNTATEKEKERNDQIKKQRDELDNQRKQQSDMEAMIVKLKNTANGEGKKRKDLPEELQMKDILCKDQERKYEEEKKNLVDANNEEPPNDPSIVTFVLVATMNPNAGPRSVALLASMQRFLSPGTVHTLLVVVPQQELHWWELAASGLGLQQQHSLFTVRVLSEDSVLKSGADFLKTQAPLTAKKEANGMGYRIQMLLKLGVAQHVPTDFYVTFDCDVALAQPLRSGVLVTKNGKGLLQGNMGGPHAERWIANSLDAFFGRTVGSTQHEHTKKYGCTVDRLRRTIGVTPAVMSKRASLLTIERLEEVAAKIIRPGMKWDAYLISTLESGLDWTEYGLYAAGTCLSGLLDEVHVLDPLLRLYDPGLQEDGSRWRNPGAMKRAFSYEGNGQIKYLFMVLQSIGGSDVVQAVSALHPHLKPVATKV